ncbi:MAG: methyltransferase domain-containing protein [Pseudomonadota bacterium]
MKKRSHRLEKMARVYDAEILPIWSRRFGRMMLRNLFVPPKAMILDVGCGTGYPSLEILQRMDEKGRIIAIETVPPLLDVARRKAGELAGKQIFFRSEPASSALAFATNVYDLVISNLGLLERGDPIEALTEFVRVTKPGGKVIVTLPLANTYDEFFDIYKEVLTKNDQLDILERLNIHRRSFPTSEQAVKWMDIAGLINTNADVEEFTLLFQSSREFFFSPVIEYGPLVAWKDIAGKGEPMQQIFWQIKEAIDAYFSGRAFELTVKAGCLYGIKPDEAIDTAEPSPFDDTTPHVESLYYDQQKTSDSLLPDKDEE